MQSKLYDLLEITKPIVQAPMAGAAGPNLVAAVANAGGFGTIPLWGKSADHLHEGIRQVRQLTDRNFAVNLNMSFPYEDLLEACIEEKVCAVSLFWGNSVSAIKRAKAGGLVVLVSVGSAAEAREAVNAGADIIVAQGWEAGGHVWGRVSTMALVPSVVDAVGDVPVIAAGGIADGRGLAAAYMLGASAAWIGTRFLASEEATIHSYYQQRILDASEDQTAWTFDLYDGGWPAAPHRTLKNSTYADWVEAGSPAPGERPDEGKVTGFRPTGEEVKNYQSYTPLLGTEGDVEAMSMWSGQGVSLVHKIMPAADIVAEISDEAARLVG